MPASEIQERNTGSRGLRNQSWLERIFGIYSGLVILSIILLVVIISFLILMSNAIKENSDYVKDLIAIFGVIVGTLSGILTSLIKKTKF